MEAFTTLTSRVAPLVRNNVDTDQIIPASYLKCTTREGLGAGLFFNWRFDESGQPRPDFELEQPACQGAQILLAGENFGCGSSREHAVWALQEHGFRAVISTRFADIFRSNSGRNGLVTARVQPSGFERLRALLAADPEGQITIDLQSSQIVLSENESLSFDIDPFARHCLLEGLDPLGFLLARLPEIEAFEAARGDRPGDAGPSAGVRR